MKRPKTRTRCAHCKRKREPGFMEWCHTRYEWQCSDFESCTAEMRRIHELLEDVCGGSKVTVIATSRDILDKVFARLAHHFSTSVTVQSTLDENLRGPARGRSDRRRPQVLILVDSPQQPDLQAIKTAAATGDGAYFTVRWANSEEANPI